jgi:hypothetical protein
VGVILENSKGIWIVQSMTQGESAHQNGQIKPGDALATIDGIEIHPDSIDLIRDLLIGDPGSMVRIGFERTDQWTNRIFFYEVDLKRKAETVESKAIGTHHFSDHQQTPISNQKPGQPIEDEDSGMRDSISLVARVMLGAFMTPLMPRSATRPRISPIHRATLSTPVSSLPATPADAISAEALRAFESAAIGDTSAMLRSPDPPAQVAAQSGSPGATSTDGSAAGAELGAFRTEVDALRAEVDALRSELEGRGSEPAGRVAAAAEALEERVRRNLLLRDAAEARASAALEREEQAAARQAEEAERAAEAEAWAEACEKRLTRCEAQLRAAEAVGKEQESAQVLPPGPPLTMRQGLHSSG